MSIQDFMTKTLYTVEPNTPINDAITLMEQYDLHRLPVVKKEKLVGLLTIGVIKKALPSTISSLSIYEMNYLLNQTKVEEIMIQKVITIEPDAQLEEGIYLMRKHRIGVLPVVKETRLLGLITSNDMFDAFLNITAFYEPGIVVTLKMKEDQKGVLQQLTQCVTQANYFITSLLVLRKKETLIQLRVQGKDKKALQHLLIEKGYHIVEILLVEEKQKLDEKK